jgi:hypothetical protein
MGPRTWITHLKMYVRINQSIALIVGTREWSPIMNNAQKGEKMPFSISSCLHFAQLKAISIDIEFVSRRCPPVRRTLLISDSISKHHPVTQKKCNYKRITHRSFQEFRKFCDELGLGLPLSRIHPIGNIVRLDRPRFVRVPSQPLLWTPDV